MTICHALGFEDSTLHEGNWQDLCRVAAETMQSENWYRKALDNINIKRSFLTNLPDEDMEGCDMEAFVPNDTLLDTDSRLIILTGPNMAGKSTYLRQVSLIVLLAQIGSFVPAASAEIGLVDRIFTRVGASDDLVRGNSTFMVEMVETASILNNATEKSLIILDEVGRGTSTFDGLSIAWAISEYIVLKTRARTLFATHYHQLTSLAEELQGIKNLSTAAREWKNEIVFLRKIVEGGTDRSYGIHVARLAGVPDKVLTRAAEILKELEILSPDIGRCAAERPAPARPLPRQRQLSLFPEEMARIREALEGIDVDATTPMQALIVLKEPKDLLP